MNKKYQQLIILIMTVLFLFFSWEFTIAKMTDLKSNPKKMTDPELKMTEMTGIASYYWTEGCLGCSPSLTMANGEKLDDTKMTVALTPDLVRQYNLLNKFVGIINPKNYKWVIAKITDTGGFKAYGRIADLSLAVKQELQCTSLCKIIIIF